MNETTSPQSSEMNSSAQSPLILVYQMGRVGSKSVEDALLRFYAETSNQIFHLHYFGNFEELEKRAKIDLADTSKFLNHNNATKALIEKLMISSPGRRIKIVSLVRDPVARNASTFLYALDEFIPNWEESYGRGTLSLDDMVDIFVSKRSFVLTALNWFDEQMKPVFDIDVYEMPFPSEIGYKIYSSTKADLLLMRLENLKSCAREAFANFLQIPNFELPTINTGSDRKTGELYRQFLKKSLPEEYIDWTYDFKLASHFYTKTELGAFKRSWTTAASVK